MWQVLLAIYIVAILLSSLIIWASLVRAKRADQKSENHPKPGTGLLTRNEEETFGDAVLKWPASGLRSKR